jgi:hypothetical protein
MRANEFIVSNQTEDRHPNDRPYGPETKPTMPAGTVRVDVSDVYDWYKLGMHISDLEGLGKHDFGKGPPSTIFSFGSEEQEHEYIKNLAKTGLTTTDIDPKDPINLRVCHVRKQIQHTTWMRPLTNLIRANGKKVSLVVMMR